MILKTLQNERTKVIRYAERKFQRERPFFLAHLKKTLFPFLNNRSNIPTFVFFFHTVSALSQNLDVVEKTNGKKIYRIFSNIKYAVKSNLHFLFENDLKFLTPAGNIRGRKRKKKFHTVLYETSGGRVYKPVHEWFLNL